MLQYEIKVLGNEMIGDNILYKLRIIDLVTLEKREIRVRYSLLYDLHNSLQDNNMNSQLPQFPKKEYLKGIFGENKVIKQREQMLGEYFTQLLRTPPPRHKELSEFLKDGVDAIRQQELQREVTQKSDFMKSLKFECILKKSQFGKTSLVTSHQRKLILHKFYVIQQQHEQQFGQYFKTHVSICDFTHVTQVHSIFYIRPKANLFDSMLGSVKPPKISKKQSLFSLIYPNVNKKLEAVKIFSIEEYEGQCLEDVIKERKQKNIPFTFDELLNFAQKLLAAISFLHKRNIMTNRIFATSVIINQDNVKLTGINEPNEKYKERYLLDGLSQDYDMVYIPPEKLNNNYNQSYNPIKVDAWQFGVCLLKAALLLTNRELDGIQQLYLQKYLNQVQQIYGDVITEMIEQSLKYMYSQRADIRDLCFLANQTAIVPFTTQYLNQNLNNQVQVIRINKLNPSEIQAITELIQKSSQILKIKLTLQQEIDQRELDKLLQLLGDFAVVQEITVILNTKTPINMTSFFSGLSSLKQLKRLVLDLKGLNFDEDELVYALAVLKDMITLEYLIIDSSSLELIQRVRDQMGHKKLILYHDSNSL